MTTHVLRIDASARITDSVTRELTDRIVARFADADVTTRDLAAQSMPHVTEEWINARVLPEADRTAEQVDTLALSDELVAEVMAADVLVLGVPVYNFGIPAALKAWIDMICRVGVTFNYTAEGPKGLLSGKRAIIAMASGGTREGSDNDFATGYLKFVLGFVGITDVSIISADQLAIDPENTLKAANDAVATLAVAA